MYDILTIGDIKLDTFILIPGASVMCELRMPACQLCLEYGTKIPAEDIETQVAGSAPNVAVGIAKMKKQSAVYSEMGKDIFHTIAVEFLKQHHVETRYVKAQAGKDSSFAAVLNYKGEATQLVAHNGGEFRLPKQMPRSKWIHVSELGEGYQRLYKELVRLAKTRDVHISLNPGVVQLKERRKELLQLIKHTAVLFLNMAEAQDLLQTTGKVETHKLLSELKQLGPRYVVVTDGKNGAYAYDGTQLDFAPMFPGERVEATGAGDSFATGFLGALMHGEPHREALKWGSVNAASVVGEIGPTKGLLSHTEIKKRLRARGSYKTQEL